MARKTLSAAEREKEKAAIAEKAKGPMQFFPHDSNAASDIKCRKLILRSGLEGYGRWWLLCELLAATSGHAIPVSDETDWLVLAEALGFHAGSFGDLKQIEDCRAYVEALLEIGLVKLTNDGAIVSDRMVSNSMYFGAKRYNGAKGGRPRKSETAGEEVCENETYE